MTDYKILVTHKDVSIVLTEGCWLNSRIEHNCTEDSDEHVLLWWEDGWECSECTFRPGRADVSKDLEEIFLDNLIGMEESAAVKHVSDFASTWLNTEVNVEVKIK